MKFSHPPCPHLPPIDHPIRATVLRELGTDRGPLFYDRALECAQSLWRRGVPAQALLLINRAHGADLQTDDRHPMGETYAAAAWILANRDPERFIGNPRRHYQHLATRMVEPRKTLRSWRAWAMWAIAREVDPSWPADERQLADELIHEPSLEEIAGALHQYGLPGEAAAWQSVRVKVTAPCYNEASAL